MIQAEFFAEDLDDAERKSLEIFEAAVPRGRREGWRREVNLDGITRGYHHMPIGYKVTAYFWPPEDDG